MNIEDCKLFKQSLLNLMGETIILRDLIEKEIQKYKPFQDENKVNNNNNNEEITKNEEFDYTKKVNKRTSKPRPVNKIIEEVKKEDEVKKTKRATKTKKETIVIDTSNLTLEI